MPYLRIDLFSFSKVSSLSDFKSPCKEDISSRLIVELPRHVTLTAGLSPAVFIVSGCPSGLSLAFRPAPRIDPLTARLTGLLVVFFIIPSPQIASLPAASRSPRSSYNRPGRGRRRQYRNRYYPTRPL